MKKSGLMAAVLNLLLPGAGYAYCGRATLGVVTFVIVVSLSVATCGIAVVPFAIMLVIDGFLVAHRYNQSLEGGAR